MHRRPVRRPVHRSTTHRSRTHRSAALALALPLTVLLAACGSGGDTTTLEASTTTAGSGVSSSTIVTSKEAIDAIVDVWVQLGFSEDQARCLADQMNKMSPDTTTPAGGSMSDQNVIEQMAEDCKIDDDSLKAQLGG